MKKLILACLSAAALVSLSACTTVKEEKPAPATTTRSTTITPGPDGADAQIIVPHSP